MQRGEAESGKEERSIKVPRTFWSKAYLKEEDVGVYRLYRDILIEGKDPRSGEAVREKFGKPIPVGKYLREAKQGEEQFVKIKTFHPIENRPLELVETDL